MSDQHEPMPGASSDPDPAIDDAALEGVVAELEATPADDLPGRLDAGERLHQALTERMSQTGRDGG